MLFNVDKNKIIAIKTRTKLRHEIKDFKFLVDKIRIKRLLGDSAYDAESLHEYCFNKNIQTLSSQKRMLGKDFI